MNLIDLLNQIWTQILAVTAIFVTPDWGFLIGMLPVIVVIGLIGPFLTGLMLGMVVYLARRPRTRVAFEEGARVAEIGPAAIRSSRSGCRIAGATRSSSRPARSAATAATRSSP